MSLRMNYGMHVIMGQSVTTVRVLSYTTLTCL